MTAAEHFHTDTTDEIRVGLAKLWHGSGATHWHPPPDDDDVTAARAWLDRQIPLLADMLARQWIVGPNVIDPDPTYVDDPIERHKLSDRTWRGSSEHCRYAGRRTDVLNRMAAGDL